MKTSWVLTEGMIGTQNQCVALAEAAGLEPEIKVVKLKQPWKTVTPWISHFCPAAMAPGSSELKAPWPEVLIASGRKAIAPALWIKKQSGGKTILIILQSPVIKNKNFDLVVVPQHDQYTGDNVLQTMGALSLITPTVLATAKEEWRGRLESLPGPRLAVLIGGNSRTHTMTEEVTKRLATQLQGLTGQHSLMITASRRTPKEYQDYLRQHVIGPNVQFWDGTGDNPYRGYLAWADALIATEDSVSMASEAVSTGKPVYILKLEGGSARFKRFHDYLINHNYARWFEGKIEPWSYTPPNDLAAARKALEKIL
jgi:mitochondrial fission protein ELM1